MGTSDVSEVFDLGTEGARRRLDDLEGCGLLASRVIGGTRVFWLTGDGRRHIQRFG